MPRNYGCKRRLARAATIHVHVSDISCLCVQGNFFLISESSGNSEGTLKSDLCAKLDCTKSTCYFIVRFEISSNTGHIRA